MKHKIVLTLLSLFLPFSFINNVSAGTNDSTITYERIDGVYYYQKDNATGEVMSSHVTKFYMNGRIAYCIEPLKQINDKVFDSTTDWSVTQLSPETRHFVELAGYYGYEYPGHNNDRYWLAAQELIWEKVRNIEVKYTTANNGGGSEIDLSKEKNEILNLINNYDVKPSFNTTEIEGNIGDEIVVTDTNNVLNQFEMVYNGEHQITKEGNTLKITLDSTTIGEDTIQFRKNNYDNQTTLIYYKGDSQKLASLRVSDPAVATLKIKSNGGTVEIDKTGEELILEDGSYNYNNIKLQNVTFAIYANEDIIDSDGKVIYKKYQLVGTLTTNELGLATLGNMYFGKYFLIEGESSQGNMVNEEKYYFEITAEDIIDGKIVKKLDFNNYLPKGQLEFTKTDIATGKPIAGTEIQIFTEDDRLVFTGTTDENGKIVIDNLFVGKFYIIEKRASDGYYNTDEKIYFEIKANGDVVKANMTNEQIVTVPDTSLNDMANIISFVLIVGGVVFLIYAKKKGNKFKK